MKSEIEEHKLEVVHDLVRGKIAESRFMSSQTQSQNELRILQNATTDFDNLTNKFGKWIKLSITDENGTIRYANTGFCSLTGYTKKQLIGKNHRILQSGYHRQPFYKQFWDRIRLCTCWHGEFRDKTQNGRYIWVDTLISPLFTDANLPRYYLSIRSEITAHMEEKRKTKPISIFANGRQIVLLPEAIRLITAHGDYTESLMNTGDTYLVLKTMDAWQKILDPKYFVRVHRSYIVNLECIERLVSRGNRNWMIHIAGQNSPIPCSRKMVPFLKDFFLTKESHKKHERRPLCYRELD